MTEKTFNTVGHNSNTDKLVKVNNVIREFLMTKEAGFRRILC